MAPICYHLSQNPRGTTAPLPHRVKPGCTQNNTQQRTHASRPQPSPWPFSPWQGPRQLQQTVSAQGSLIPGGPTAHAPRRTRPPTRARTTGTSASTPVASRHRLERPLWILVTAALLLLPSVVGETEAKSTAAFSFEAATVSLVGGASSTNATALRVFPGTGSFEWSMAAHGLVVNRTVSKYIEVGRPPDFGQALYRSKISTTSDERTFSLAEAAAARRTANSTLVVVGPSTMAADASISEVTIKIARNTTWRIPTGSPDAGPEFDLPAGNAEASTPAGHFNLNGTLTAFGIDGNITIHHSDGVDHFESGTWTESIAPPAGSNGPVRYRYYQYIRVEARKANLTLSTTNQEVVFLANQLTLAGTLKAVFAGATGTATVDGAPRTLEHERFETQGRGSLSIWNSTENPPRMRAALHFGEGKLSDPVLLPLDADQQPAATNPTLARPDHQNPFLVGAAGLTAAATAAVIVVRNGYLTRPTIMDVEWALLNRDGRRARRWAEQLVRRAPSDGDAVFLLSSAYLLRKDLRTLVNRIEPLAKKLPRATRAAIAFTLAVAWIDLGRQDRAQSWAQEAAVEPEFAKQLPPEILGNAPKGPPDTGLVAYA